MKNIFKLQLYKCLLLIFFFAFWQIQITLAQCINCPEITFESDYISIQFNSNYLNQQIPLTISIGGASGCFFSTINETVNLDETGFGKIDYSDQQQFDCLSSGQQFVLSFNDYTCNYGQPILENQPTLLDCTYPEPPVPPSECPDCPELNYSNGQLTLTYSQIYAYSEQEIVLSCGTFTAYLGSIDENSQVTTQLPPNSQQCFNESSISISMYGGKTCTYESLSLIDCEIPAPICEECPQINIYKPAAITYVAFQFNENTNSPQEVSV